MRLAFLALDVEQQRSSAHFYEGQRLVVRRHAVAGEALEPHAVVVEIALLRRAPEDQRLRLAGVHDEAARLDFNAVFKQPRKPFPRQRTLDERAQFQRRALVQPRLARGQRNRTHIQPQLARDGHGIEPHAGERGLTRGRFEIAARLVAIGQQNHARGRVRREKPARQGYARGEISLRAAGEFCWR